MIWPPICGCVARTRSRTLPIGSQPQGSYDDPDMDVSKRRTKRDWLISTITTRARTGFPCPSTSTTPSP